MTLFLWNIHQCLVQLKLLQFLVSSQSIHQWFLITYYSSHDSSLKKVPHKCTYCQKAMTWIKCDCETWDIFFCSDRFYGSVVKRHDQIFLWVEYIVTILYIPFENMEMFLCQLKRNLWIYKIYIFFFMKSWNQFSNTFIKNESKTAYFSLFLELCLVNTLKYKNIICHKLELIII